MSRNCAVLLGAGISVDAGIPSSFALTRAVYDKLRTIPGNVQATLFGYILAKLTARGVLSGGSPFDAINIEDAFDALLRLIQRDNDILSEFVNSWDPILDYLKPQFDEASFAQLIAESVRDQRGLLSSGSFSVDTSRLKQAAQTISAVLNSGTGQHNAAGIAGMYVDILVGLLSTPANEFLYLDDLVRFSAERVRVVATLNYDLLFERAARRCNVPFDYGLSDWKDKQVLRATKGGMSLLKLHGSINWSGPPESFNVSEDAAPHSKWQRSDALMIFGGQSSKLTPHGPFLQLRHMFESGLMRSDRLLVAGYSFGDVHINALIKRWVSTRSIAKMVILNPSDINFGLDVFLKSYIFTSTERRKTVDIVHMKRTAANGLGDAIRSLTSQINTKFDTSIGGLLPHILITRIT